MGRWGTGLEKRAFERTNEAATVSGMKISGTTGVLFQQLTKEAYASMEPLDFIAAYMEYA